MRLLRTLAPLALVAGLLAACGGGSSSGSGDSTIVGAAPGFEARTVYARYAPGVPFGPEVPQALVKVMSSTTCPMKAAIVDSYLMECDPGKTVYALQNPLVVGHLASAVPKQIGHKNIWYVEASFDPSTSQKLASQLQSMTGEQIAFTYGGAVLASVAVDSSFHPDHFAITGNYDQASATKLAQELTG